MKEDTGRLLLLGLVVLGVLGLLYWAAESDSKALDAKHQAFSASCAADHRKPYDCNLQWETYAEAHAAKESADSASTSAAVAVGVSAASAGRR